MHSTAQHSTAQHSTAQHSTAQHNKSAFSLIELMVVVAIIAVLTAIAVPTYQGYMLSAKAAAVTKVIAGLAEQSILFSESNGRFGSAYDLGLSTTMVAGDTVGTVDNPSALSPYFNQYTYISMGDTSTSSTYGPNTPCGQSGEVYAALDPYEFGIPGVTGPNHGAIYFYYVFWYYNGVLQIEPYYYYVTFNDSGGVFYDSSGNIVPGWINYFSDTLEDVNPAYTAAYATYSNVCP